MIICRIALDSSPDALTLRQLKNEMLRYVREDSVVTRQELKAFFKQADFEARVSALEKNVQEIRNNYLAHFDREWNLNPSPNRASVSFTDLKSLLSALEQLLRLLSLNVEMMLWYWDYLDYAPNVYMPKGRTPTSDIDELLDAVARQSDLLNLPENSPFGMDDWGSELSDSDLALLNQYRSKFGLPEINKPLNRLDNTDC
jgi:hypothetical protein